MIQGLKPYPAMKESGVPWLGEVPEHWTEKRAKYFYREADERSVLGDEELLSVSHKTGVTPRKQNVTMFLAESTVGYKICRPGDVAINTMWAFMGAMGVARQVGLVSPAYGVYRPHKADAPNPDYLDRLLRLDAYKSEYTCRSTGINSSRLRLYPDEFLRIPIICPPPAEQAAIVSFLDHADRKIRRYIRAKQKLIKLLEEQKQAIIHRAVTRGLDPDVRLKPSGVEWLGDVPEHWEVKKVRQCGAISGGMTPSMAERSLWDGDIPWVTPKDMKRFTITRASMTVSARALEATSLKLLPAESVLLVVRGMILARRVPIARTTAPVTINQDMKAIVPSADIAAGFLSYLMDSAQDAYRPLIDEAGHGTKRFPTERLKDVVLAIPPAVEQSMIVHHLDQATAHIADALDSAQHQIALIHEYRTRLIADVVTGKLDVREAAAGLLEEAEPMDSMDPDDDLQDLEDLDSEAEEQTEDP